MKFMANGAVTLGTMDGTNVEIAQLVGPDNSYTFGASGDTVIDLYARGGTCALEHSHRPAAGGGRLCSCSNPLSCFCILP